MYMQKKKTHLFCIKVLMENVFSPLISNYSSFEELTLVGKFTSFIKNEELNHSKELFKYLSYILNDDIGYQNSFGNTITTKLIEIAGIQEIDEEINLSKEFIEVYRYFYPFERQISKEEFLKLYYFDDARL